MRIALRSGVMPEWSWDAVALASRIAPLASAMGPLHSSSQSVPYWEHCYKSSSAAGGGPASRRNTICHHCGMMGVGSVLHAAMSKIWRSPGISALAKRTRRGAHARNKRQAVADVPRGADVIEHPLPLAVLPQAHLQPASQMSALFSFARSSSPTCYSALLESLVHRGNVAVDAQCSCIP